MENKKIELIDENGEKISFKFEDSFRYNEVNYVILTNELEEAILFKYINEDDKDEFIRLTEEEFEIVSEAYYESEN